MIFTIFVAAITRRWIVGNSKDRLLFTSPPIFFFPLSNLFDDPGL